MSPPGAWIEMRPSSKRWASTTVAPSRGGVDRNSVTGPDGEPVASRLLSEGADLNEFEVPFEDSDPCRPFPAGAWIETVSGTWTA